MAKQATPKQTTKLADSETLNGSNTLPALIEIAPGHTVQLGEVVMAAFKVSSLTADAWNALPEAERDGLLSSSIEVMKAVGHDNAGAARKEQEEVAARAAADAAALQARQPSFGPRAKQEIRYRGKTYGPGDRLPADIDEKTFDELDELGAI